MTKRFKKSNNFQKFNFLLFDIFRTLTKTEYRKKKIITKANHLEAYQKEDLRQIIEILYRFFPKPPRLQVLDIGCSTSQIVLLSKIVKEITGINIDLNHAGNKKLNANVRLLEMDGTNLLFPDNSFDFIYSLNVLEHIDDVEKCFKEQFRVLKPGGYAFAKWSPLWSGPRGHHIHEDMVRAWVKQYSDLESCDYKNNGTIIPDWGHLLYTKSELKSILIKRNIEEIIADKIVHFIFDTDEINRVFFDKILKIIESGEFKLISLNKTESTISNDVLEKLQYKYNINNFTTLGCALLLKK